jgi:hypothetical protein
VHRSVDGGDHNSYFNIINNYLKPGPATPNGPISYRLLKPESERSKTVVDHFGQAYVNGNVVEGNERVTKDNWDGGVQPDSKAPVGEVLPKIRQNEPIKHAKLTIQPAQEAYAYVLENAGAIRPKRDPVDARVIEMVRSGKVSTQPDPDIEKRLNDVGLPMKVSEVKEISSKGIITSPAQVGGYPEYMGEPYADADKDGMSDAWEKEKGLNPSDPSDASADQNGDGYTNIEEFINH